MENLDRRGFLGKAGRIAAGLGGLYIVSTLPGCGKNGEEECPVDEGPRASPSEIPSPDGTVESYPGLVVVRGSKADDMLLAGLEAWGGMEALVLADKRVLIKVNAAFSRPPGDAATTSPDLVAGAVRMCLEAGASKVTVFDHTLQDLADKTIEINGIGPAAEAAGAEMIAYAVRKPGKARIVEIPGATALPSAGVLEEIFQADVLINMPKAKHHGGAGLSLSMKNLIGCLQNMGQIHQIELHRAVAELNTVIKPALVIMDATTILLDNGPGGPGTVADPGEVIIGTDPVAVDSYACGLFGLTPSELGHIVYGEELGVGTSDFTSLGVGEVAT
ncbi:MAG: DUF362 domain-containing protein [Actinomycetota bacterium]|nr:DUF362 domain-containing protein [Actinomycetota bacterium]